MPAAGLMSMQKPKRCPRSSSIRNHTAEPVTSAPAVDQAVPRRRHRGVRDRGERSFGDVAHSAWRRSAVRVRAAWSPGIAATRLARTSAPTAMSAIVSAGTVGWGTAWIARAKRSQSDRPRMMPSGDADDDADGDGDRRLPGDDGCELTAGEAECFEEREFASAASYRCDECERERGDGADGQGDAEQCGCGAHRAVVDDLRGSQDAGHAAGGAVGTVAQGVVDLLE